MSIIGLPIAVAILVVAIMLARKLGTIVVTFMSWRKSAIIAGVYLLGLILSVVIAAVLPNHGFGLMERSHTGGSLQKGNVSTISYTIRTQNDFERQPGLYLNSRQTFKIDQRAVKLGFAPNPGHFQIYVEQKETDDGKIDVLTYCTPSYIGDTDYTKLLQPPKVISQDGSLVIEPVRQTLTLRLFKSNFTQSQFEGKNAVNLHNFLSSSFGWGEVLLRVPKSTKIDKGQNYLQYLDKD
ncbi:hypothetical protein ACPUYX_10260 [Desulfosporosinus sp. SYSU MS00001]|uniref:hypothetical protein n=1 Tax=Desulfosporosinus sp. SYSU MS00001 TaxID=3416284 RepID=UPI003CF66217